MWKKILVGGAITLVAVVALGFLFRQEVVFMLISSQIAPDHDFEASLAPTAPDYTQDAAWAALPGKADPSDDRPPGSKAEATGVKTFFVHPTSYLKPDNWNQPLTDEGANWIIDERVLRHQASIFNACCEVHAPRYRQATFFSFLDDSGNGEKALELAYEDVARAFDHFVATQLTTDSGTSPFILAGHSQGTQHAARLLREKIANSALQESLVAAYLVGFLVRNDELAGIPVCTSATQTGCAVGWNAMLGDGPGIYAAESDLLCVNPLTWQADDQYAGHELNIGAIGYPTYGSAIDGEDVTQMTVEPGAADAQCVNSQLSIPDLRVASFPSRMPGESLHVYDYSLFHMNIRENVLARATAFQAP